ncbi:MAG: polysaccharide biosynthesis/export family protein [Planctomycetota bacterium]|jgi:protein involved in polysaccharide export with SLBB domain
MKTTQTAQESIALSNSAWGRLTAVFIGLSQVNRKARNTNRVEGRCQKSEVSFVLCSLPSILIFCFLLTGCGSKFFDPPQIGRFRPVPAVNVILDSLGVAEEAPSAWEGTEDPRPIDVMAFETDYTFGSGDIVRIAIFELLTEGAIFANDYVVTETGRISIPEVGVIDAAGLTETQLEEEMRRILEPSILREASITVILMRSQRRTFSISGNGVPIPGRYEIPRYDFRLLDALATAGGINQFNISYVYVARSVTGKEAIAEPVEPEVTKPEFPELEEQKLRIKSEQEMLEIIAPRAKGQQSENGFVIASAEMITNKEIAEAALPKGVEPSADGGQGPKNIKDVLDVLESSIKLADQKTIDKPTDTGGPTDEEVHINSLFRQSQKDIKDVLDVLESSIKLAGQKTIDKPTDTGEPTDEEKRDRIEWIFRDGQWVPVQVGRPVPTEPEIKGEPEKVTKPLREKVPADFDWDQIGAGGEKTRVIKIPADRLNAGDPRYNIVIRPGDSIQVPVDIIGEFCIMGNTNYQGYLPITGRPMTLMMAIAAAGGLGPLAWPNRCEVRRRIGTKKEEIVMVDLDKIARGEQPDFFIKPNDLINVGTHPTSRWRAVLRNAFRATYGFGFVYDRNFADRDYYTRRPIPDWF